MSGGEERAAQQLREMGRFASVHSGSSFWIRQAGDENNQNIDRVRSGFLYTKELAPGMNVVGGSSAEEYPTCLIQLLR